MPKGPIRKSIIITKFNYFKDYCCESDIRKLDLIEQLGTENLAHFSLGENRLIAKTSGRTSLKNGDIISFAIDTNHAYFFDPLNGKRIK